MRFATRIFLFSFVPFGLLLLGTFWTIQHLTHRTVRETLRSSLKEGHGRLAALTTRREAQNRRFLQIVAENPALKAGLQLTLLERSGAARQTLLDQLSEIGGSLSLDLLAVEGPEGEFLTGVLRAGARELPLDAASTQLPRRGLWSTQGSAYRLTTVPVNQAGENLGALIVGERLSLAEFPAPVALLHQGRVVDSNLPGGSPPELAVALRDCGTGECELRLRAQTFVSLPVEGLVLGEGYQMRSLQNLDAASAPVQSVLGRVFAAALGATLLAAYLLSYLSSRGVTRPLTEMIARLREGEASGDLPELPSGNQGIREIRTLTESFNRTASAAREARSQLDRAYVEFVGSMAGALDARDRYTAGHSRRVSFYAGETARAMNLSASDVDDIRIGALLHDIGKIGILDRVLQKPGKLTAAEFALIQEHPAIGRRILQGIHGFERYLPIVELHHENWDGSGYPRGLHGDQTPLAARIVHVVDAYDAMTSDRPYRPGMDPAQALAILRKCSGTQFDRDAVEGFAALIQAGVAYRTPPPPPGLELQLESVARLAQAVTEEGSIPESTEAAWRS